MKFIFKSICFIFCLGIILSTFSVSAMSQTELLVETEFDEINKQSDYTLSFQTTLGDYFKLFYGQLVITLPKGFSTDGLDSVEVIDEFKHFSYIVQKIEIDENSIRLFLKMKLSISVSDIESEYSSDMSHPINLKVKLSRIQNPPQPGDYQISLIGLANNQKIAFGPFLSDPFEITPASIHSIVVTPSEPLLLKAGDVQQFSASAFDEYGNKIEGAVFEWSLFDCTNCIGQFSDSSLSVTRVGEAVAQATADGVSGFSGLITVTAGDLARMTLQIGETQFVGSVINHDAAVILYDAYNNLKTDYDLETTPIELVISSGELNRYLLDNNSFQVGGVVRLKDFEIVYQGLSGDVNIYADNGLVLSNIELVYFNNYDIVDVLNSSGETISSVFAGHTTSATVLIQNNGNLQATGKLNVRVVWESDNDSITFIYLVDPPVVGEVAEIIVELPALISVGSSDELIVTVWSSYFNNDANTISERIFSVEVLGPAQLSLIPDSFKPDSIIHQIPFDISFEIQTEGFAQAIDSTNLVISVFDKNSNQLISNVFEGSPVYSSFANGIIGYTGLSAILNHDSVLPNGWYDVVMDYKLFSNGNMLTLTESVVDSIYIFFDNGLTLVEGSLTPKIVYAGTNVSFEFKVHVESDVPLPFHGVQSQFRIYDESFSTSTNLFLENDSLYPGLNILRSAVISIQPEQVGADLFAEAKFLYCLPGLLDSLKFITNFTSQSVPIQVFDLPLVQILDLEVIAPNSPIVNSLQEIQFQATVANLSSTSLDSVTLELKSIDGSSVINNPILSAYNLTPFDTVTVLFDVTASSVSQDLPEGFRVDVFDNSIGMIAPINNSAYLIIEDEALIAINYRINGIENAEGVVVSQGEQFHVQLDFVNNGTADVADGNYQFIVSGLNSNQPDTFMGLFCSDSTIEFEFIAPLKDATMQFSFLVTELPIDKNYNAPAKILNESFEFTVLSVSSSAEIIVEATTLGTNLVLPGRIKELFEISITNNSNSSLNSIELELIDLKLFTSSHIAIEARDIIASGNTSFFENEEKLTITTAGGNELMFWFDNFIIAPQETRTIVMEAEFKESSYKDILLEIPLTSFKAKYIDGPNVGQDVLITSSGGSDILSYQIVLKGNSLDESFIIENNPFNPLIKPVQFAYELTEDTPIEFQMFTLTGEEVFRANYPAGSHGALLGENIIEWDGRNNSGDMVLNGVYIASIINKTTGEYARIKVAVVK